MVQYLEYQVLFTQSASGEMSYDLSTPYYIERDILESELKVGKQHVNEYIFDTIEQLDATIEMLSSGQRASKRIKGGIDNLENTYVYFRDFE